MPSVGELTVNLQVVRIPTEITFVSSDDWVALYIDGTKAIDGHSLHWSHVLDALGVRYERREAPVIESGRNGDVIFGETLEDVAVHYYSEGE